MSYLPDNFPLELLAALIFQKFLIIQSGKRVLQKKSLYLGIGINLYNFKLA